MTDLTPQILPQLQAHRLPELNLGDGFILPNYAGLSILNIPASLCSLFGIPGLAGTPLNPEILQPLGEGVRRVVLLLVDGLAFHRLQRWMTKDAAPVWQRVAEAGLLSPITSITPSTTSAALSSLWTGRSAAQHGIAGYEMWLKEYGIVANMITHAPITFQNDVGSLTKAGFQPENYLQAATLGTHFAAHGIRSYALQHQSIARSGLSTMLFKDVEVHSFVTTSDLWVNLRHLLENKTSEKLYAWVYLGEVDHFSHFYGPEDERTAAEFAALSHGFERLLLDKLSLAARKDTLFILTSDHGQIVTPQYPYYATINHPALTRRLHINPTGENRMFYLYERPGQSEAVREYIERIWPNQFTLLDPAFAVSAGLFGPGEPHPRLLDRLGDAIVLARDSAYLWWSEKENKLLGRHGGLSPDEMLSPFLAARFSEIS